MRPPPRKPLGQHYLSDPAILARIARAAVADGTGGTFLEIGPGPGGLTRALLEHGVERLLACERDERFLPGLEALQGDFPERLAILKGDALALPLAPLADPPPLRIVGNLPYNISTRLLGGWLRQLGASFESASAPLPDSMTLMFQDEVAERIIAESGSPHYGRLSVLCGWLCHRERLFRLAPGAFHPPPKVRSAAVHLVRRDVPAPPLEAAGLPALEAVTRAAFGTRRKMLRRALARMPTGAGPLLEAAGLSGTERAEEVPLGGFLEMARLLQAHGPAEG